MVIYDDPRYYPYRSGRGRNVVVTRPTHPGARFVFRDAAPGRDSVTREASGGRTDDEGRRRGGADGRSSLDIGGPGSVPTPGVQPLGGRQAGPPPALSRARRIIEEPSPGGAARQRVAGPGRPRFGAGPGARARSRSRSRTTLALRPADSQTPQHRRARASPPQALSVSRWIRALAVAAGMALIAAPARGQGLAEGAVESIGSADMAARVGILSDDSMMGRDTPSAGLERAAAYVIGEFRRLGLRPGGRGRHLSAALRRHPMDRGYRRLPHPAAAPASTSVTADFARGARFVAGRTPDRPVSGAGRGADGSAHPRAVSNPLAPGRVVLVPVDYSRPLAPDLGDRLDQLAARAAAVVLLSNRDSATRAQRLATSLEPRLTPDFRRRFARRAGGGAVRRDRGARAGGRGARSGAPPRRRRSQARENPHLASSSPWPGAVLERGDPPNLVAALDGSDPELAGEYVAISAHLDHIGMRAGPGDSIYNGADDNASGVAGLLELAEAFAGGEPAARPEHRRSLLFVVPSGEEKGLWGSDYFTRHPTVPLDRIVADLNMDLIGRNWSDSIIVVGPELSTLGATLARPSRPTPSSG